eukprot:CAMPEP_0201548968 /NCGR_PEP_ID=MMETSP0173_2-20130828/5455_1 /ASSEMBLY_ACC=CAM_ASM_000268 /TAXON_ID=218659 /ORGANISM="Vexillifera sp., Strain DIVA3 564/2" /LENGTH=224 /DNA_ID=CAMNT_0047958493 /DNA_START=51 /DNA_END=722 /DNA_ORIENTATION=+
MACRDGKLEKVRDLLPKVNVNAKYQDGYSRVTPLCAAISNNHKDTVELLLSHPKIEVNKLGGRTPLCVAIEKDHKDIIKMLLSHPDIDPNKNSGRMYTPLIDAVHGNQKDAVAMLLSHPDIDPNKGHGGSTPLIFAIEKNYKEVGMLLLSHPDIDTVTGARISEMIQSCRWERDAQSKHSVGSSSFDANTSGATAPQAPVSTSGATAPQAPVSKQKEQLEAEQK